LTCGVSFFRNPKAISYTKNIFRDFLVESKFIFLAKDSSFFSLHFIQRIVDFLLSRESDWKSWWTWSKVYWIAMTLTSLKMRLSLKSSIIHFIVAKSQNVKAFLLLNWIIEMRRPKSGSEAVTFGLFETLLNNNLFVSSHHRHHSQM
jgi:hypothetical protein